jgi:hypothetical protein
MKNLLFIFIAISLFSCDNDDNVASEPVPIPTPIIANAKVVRNGSCGEDHYFIEMYQVSQDSFPSSLPDDFFTYYDWPEEFRVNDLEIFLDYRNPTPEEFRVCTPSLEVRHIFVAREILLPTP